MTTNDGDGFVKRDSIFFQIFQQSQCCYLICYPVAPENANTIGIAFASIVAVKGAEVCEIDGVFLPPGDQPGWLYYAEFSFGTVAFVMNGW
jgi:hypothetical protein